MSDITGDQTKMPKFTEGKARKNKDELLAKFNLPSNNKGQFAKIIIINSAAAEGITIKNVRFVHLLHLPPNVSQLFQIIGRAIRNCTHKTLLPDERTVTPILYLDESNEKKYSEKIRENRNNVIYLDLLKQCAIDCELTKQMKPTQKCMPTDEDAGLNEWVGYQLCCGEQYTKENTGETLDDKIIDLLNTPPPSITGGNKYKKNKQKRKTIKYFKSKKTIKYRKTYKQNKSKKIKIRHKSKRRHFNNFILS